MDMLSPKRKTSQLCKIIKKIRSKLSSKMTKSRSRTRNLWKKRKKNQ